eukprot:CAMPEP_0118658980 /NCGR_PEP_ID=MMETSP0785-20121206/14859_1 /TAXON_ID=91992 /ORGANISM="Bolidomonas pacifica, Strain CCMP 1866" /LENGTH=62 /DNA_ID=CAMNT_0006552037 /DNA_START=97 /DNA_END=285 /DNA_ORIENTATION=-
MTRVGREEVEHVVGNFESTYGVGWSAWKMLKAEVESIGRTDEEEEKDEMVVTLQRQPRCIWS